VEENEERMAYELIKEDGSSRVVRFTMDAAGLKKIFRKVRSSISREASIPGFRPGHVPDSIMDRKFGNLIIAEVAEQAHKELTKGLFDQFDWVLSDKEPVFENLLPVEGEDYTYTVTYDLFQMPAPVDYRGVKLLQPSFDLDKSVEETIGRLRKQFVTFEETDQPSAEGDMVVLTYPDPDTGEPRDLSAVIGMNDIGPGFDELITAVSPGDSFSMRIEVQKGGEPTSPAGPSHTFTVKEVRAHSYPEPDDEFASRAGGFETMDQLRDKIREDLSARYESEMGTLRERQAMDSIVNSNAVDVPRFMVDNLKEDYLSRIDSDERDGEAEKAALEMAKRKVQEFLLLREIAIAESLEVPEEDIDTAVESGDSRSAFLDRSRNELALSFILDNAIVETVEPSEPDPHAEGTDTVPWRWVRAEPDTSQAALEDQGDS
jgi:trigger factor